MPGEATTEGSIVAYLRLNTSDWDAKLDQAAAKARELGRIDPDIKVTADTAEALAKLEAVREAEARTGGTTTTVSRVTTTYDSDAALQAAQQRVLAVAYAQADAAAERLRVAQEADNAAMREGSADAIREAAATEALAAAERRATDEAIANIAARRKNTSATLENAAADDVQAAAADNAANANKGNLGYMGLIVAAIAAAIPLGGALAGATVAIAGGMAGMGAAGVLAVLGIKNEMADGTAVGNQYAAGIQVLLGDLHQLEATAAGGVLTGFEQSLGIIHASLPDLNKEIGTFSTEIGTAGTLLVSGIVTGMRVLNPLLITGGVYVEQLAAGFQQWTSNGGLAKFAQDAMAALPQVTQALGSLLQGALALIEALAPLGTIMLGIISILGGLLAVIAPLVGALAPLALAAAAVYGAFMLWKGIKQPIQDAAAAVRGFGLDLTVMGGLAGLAIAALGYIASSFVNARIESSNAAAALQNYTSAVQQDNGVIGQNVKLQTAKALADKNALGQYNSLGKSAIDIGRQLGLSAKTVTDAADGQHGAILQVNKAMTDYAANPANSTAKVAAFRANWINLTAVISDNYTAIQKQIKAYNEIAAAQGMATISTAGELHAQQGLASAYGMSVPEMLGAAAAQKQNADQAKATTQQLQFENDAAGLLTNAFKLLNGTNLDVAQAQTAAAAATNTFTDSLKQNNLTIDGNSKGAIANQQALQQKAAADQMAAEAIAKQTGSTEAGTKAFGQSKAALEAELRAAGNLTPAIQALIDKYYAVPPVVKTKAEMDADAAMAKIAALKASLASVHDQTVTLTVVTNNVGAPAQMPANVTGGAYKFAHGGSVAGGINYLAAGGDPWRPQGTDTVRAMLTPGEFVVKQKSAAYNPQFMKAYNDDPARALSSVGSKSGDRPIYMDGSLFGMLREMANGEARIVLNQSDRRLSTGISANKQKGAF